jgi:seryl-tRNA synthetase
MIGFVEELLRRLGLPHRLLQCCTGDLGPKNADMIDLECWMPSRAEGRGADEPGGSAGWGETHSASRLYDYQCRRLGIRYKDPKPVLASSSLSSRCIRTPMARSRSPKSSAPSWPVRSGFSNDRGNTFG